MQKPCRKSYSLTRPVPPTIICVRHAQGQVTSGNPIIHNLSVANQSIPDPDLTPYGEEQCRHLAQSFPYHSSVELLVCSPLRRTIYTTLLGFKPEIDRGVKVIALPEVQETGDVPCDTGTDIAVLRKEMEGKPIDLGRLTDGWNSNIGKWSPAAEAVKKRAREVRQWLKARPEKEIVVVTHGGFLHFITEDWAGYQEGLGTGWSNVEYRTFQFADGEDDNASITETAQSLAARRGTEKPLTQTERMELRETVEKSCEADEVHPLQAKV
ncbi:MAG: hypothetical protein Q9217_000459 [Psora testacea]